MSLDGLSLLCKGLEAQSRCRLNVYETHFWHLTKVRPLTNVSLLIRIRGGGGGPNTPADTTDYFASQWGKGVCFYSADSTKLRRGNQDATRTGKTLSLEPKT